MNQIGRALDRRQGAPRSTRFLGAGDEGTGTAVEPPTGSVRTEATGKQKNISRKDGSRRLGRVSLAVADICARSIEPSVKARMLRELAVWYRAFAARTANPVIWEARLLTAEDLDAEASRIEQQRAPDGPVS
jgi:hypothetical protein